MNQLLSLLQKYGFSERHARVYLHLMSKLEDTTLGIASTTMIPRTTVYTLLSDLKNQHLVSSFRKNKTQYWTPENASQLQANLKNKQEIADTLVPLLQNMLKAASPNSSSVRLFTGKEGLKVVWEDIISTLETYKLPFVYAITHMDLYSVLPMYFPAWIKRRRASKVFAKLIVPPGHTYLRTDEGQEVRSMPEKYVFTGDMTIYGKKVALFIFKEPDYESVIIDSPAFAAMIQGFFDFTWDNLGVVARV